MLAQGTPDAPRGITVDIARELAKRLGVPVEFNCFDQAARRSKVSARQNLDIAFLAIEPVRAAEIEFTAALCDHRRRLHGGRRTRLWKKVEDAMPRACGSRWRRMQPTICS